MKFSTFVGKFFRAVSPEILANKIIGCRKTAFVQWDIFEPPVI